MSESEEMYLISILRLREDGLEGPVPLSRLAEDLSVVPVSVNQMIKKLAAAGLVRYQPYKGVSLTRQGRKLALQVLRHRRLWEFFLVERLGLSAQEADALACRMEHITSEPVADRLAAYLEHPQTTADGKPIPEHQAESLPAPHSPLSDLEVGLRGCVEFVEADENSRRFLESQGVNRGAEVSVLARAASGSMLIECKGEQISVAPEIARSIHVQVSSSPETGERETLSEEVHPV